MKVEHLPVIFADQRGEIRDILQEREVNSLTILTCAQGSVRGNHFHKETTQFTYIVQGSFELATQYGDEPVQNTVVRAGDLVVSPPLEKHAFRALEDSILLAGCYGPRAGTQYETDTFRLEQPLLCPE